MIDMKAIAHEVFDLMAVKLEEVRFKKIKAIKFASLWRDGRYVMQPEQVQDEKGKWYMFSVGCFGEYGGNKYEVDVDEVTERLKKEEENDRRNGS